MVVQNTLLIRCCKWKMEYEGWEFKVWVFLRIFKLFIEEKRGQCEIALLVFRTNASIFDNVFSILSVIILSIKSNYFTFKILCKKFIWNSWKYICKTSKSMTKYCNWSTNTCYTMIRFCSVIFIFSRLISYPVWIRTFYRLDVKIMKGMFQLKAKWNNVK